MKITTSTTDPYLDKIKLYLYSQFPTVATPTSCELFEMISTILVGTKDIRYGAIPSPESLVVIRKTIRESIENNVPIPVLVPWGSMKADFSDTIDIAEVMAIKRLVCTNELVKQFYRPGLDIVIRVEDLSGYSLFAVDYHPEQVIEKVNSYSSKLVDLVHILSKGSIVALRETEMGASIEFRQLVEEYLPLFVDYLEASEKYIQFMPQRIKELVSYQALVSIGWTGMISREQREFYYDAYNRYYSDSSLNTQRLALYFSQALARRKLGLTGIQPHWKSNIQITFVAPIKGLPEGYHNNLLYYRTIPASQGRTHIPPWRAKGYLKIDEDDSICAKITSINESIEGSELITIEDATKSVQILIRYE